MLLAVLPLAYQTRKIVRSHELLVYSLFGLIFIQSIFIKNYIEESIYTAIISVILIRILIDRSKNITRILLYGIYIFKLYYDTSLFLEGQYVIYNVIIDILIIILSILSIELYSQIYYKINSINDIVIPSLFALLVQTPYAIALPVLQGLFFAVFNISLIYSPLILLSLILNYFINFYIFNISNFNLLFIWIDFLLFLITYFSFHRRLSFRSLAPPIGWLNSWLAGKYYVNDVIGVGGFSYVLRVSTGREVMALKVLRYTDDRGMPLASSWDVIRIFGQEMNRYLQVSSDYVVRAYEVSIPSSEYKSMGEYMKNPPYMVLEYMAGGSLREYLTERGPLSLNEFINIFIQISKGLYDIHKNNLVHLDIKPENIMFKDIERKHVKIGDLGIAKLAVGKMVSASYLSPAYAAPEVLKSQLGSKESDIYSLGCVMYESLTGINPQSFVLNNYEVPPPDRYRPDIPAWLSSLIMSMLSPVPEMRPTIEQVLNSLENGVQTILPR